MLANVELSEGDVLFRSDQYVQLGCDLRDLVALKRVLTEVVDIDKCKLQKHNHNGRTFVASHHPGVSHNMSVVPPSRNRAISVAHRDIRGTDARQA
jgi:hypothetical protein